MIGAVLEGEGSRPDVDARPGPLPAYAAAFLLGVCQPDGVPVWLSVIPAVRTDWMGPAVRLSISGIIGSSHALTLSSSSRRASGARSHIQRSLTGELPAGPCRDFHDPLPVGGGFSRCHVGAHLHPHAL